MTGEVVGSAYCGYCLCLSFVFYKDLYDQTFTFPEPCQLPNIPYHHYQYSLISHFPVLKLLIFSGLYFSDSWRNEYTFLFYDLLEQKTALPPILF